MTLLTYQNQMDKLPFAGQNDANACFLRCSKRRGGFNWDRRIR